MTPVVIEVGAVTDVGRVREHNEDAYLVEDRIFAVADGMGGHAAGEVASAIAIDTVGDLVEAEPIRTDDVVAALTSANERILESVAQNPDQRGMGTTITGVALVSAFGTDHWAVFNVGDSRVYRLLHGRLRQVTVDHSEIRELMDAGMITAEEAKFHPARNVITRSLGMDFTPQPDLWVFPPADEEVFLICSDGLSNEVSLEDMSIILEAEDDPQRAADRLCEEALRNGGRDNISVVVVRARTEQDHEPDSDTEPRDRGDSDRTDSDRTDADRTDADRNEGASA